MNEEKKERRKEMRKEQKGRGVVCASGTGKEGGREAGVLVSL